jgi:hypothetical protein
LARKCWGTWQDFGGTFKGKHVETYGDYLFQIQLSDPVEVS